MSEIHLRIATYNIRKALGNDRRRDPARTLRVIEALDADIVLLQEADMRLGLRPPALPPSLFDSSPLQYIPFAHGRDSLGWHGNAILIRDGIEVLAVRHTDLPGLEPRGAVLADLRFDGQLLRVIGTHLGLMRASRRRQLAALRAFADQAQAKACVVAGDFNEWSGLSHLAGLGTEYRVLPSPPTFHARKPVAALDRIAVSDAFTLRDIQAVMTPEARRASDHLPLVADLTLKGA
ncbi:endonuclease/exonuclease/phosphatase family protein [Cypionkella sinensis]|uniref:Endonuclease/exonuclease/phosphatase family protein n=1 Tax=Cypionkella sinensis TaxID=1756043 RepID=A0ABV7IZP6_9RHOB